VNSFVLFCFGGKFDRRKGRTQQFKKKKQTTNNTTRTEMDPLFLKVKDYLEKIRVDSKGVDELEKGIDGLVKCLGERVCFFFFLVVILKQCSLKANSLAQILRKRTKRSSVKHCWSVWKEHGNCWNNLAEKRGSANF
jgi:hypothetical protein